MNLYLISQKTKYGHGVYTDCLVAAETAAIASKMSPLEFSIPDAGLRELVAKMYWVTETHDVTVKHVGIAAEGIEQGVILAAR